MPDLTSISPQFQVTDLARSLAWYRETLGFDQVIDYGGFYASVRRGSAEIHLKCAPALDGQRAHQRANDHIDAYMTTDDVQALYAQCQRRGARITQPLTTHPWNATDFQVEDPDGYRLCFAQAAD